MAWGSTIPATIGALVDLWGQAETLQDVWVSDGPAIGNDAAVQIIEVGHVDNDDAVRGDSAVAGLSLDALQESYTILCSATAMDGGNDQAASRTAAFTLYGACCDALAADPTLSRTVLQSRPGEVTVRQYATDQGVACQIIFAVSVTAFSL